MARAVWTGSVSFGLVNVPVQMFSAIEPHQVSFHQVDRKTGERIRYRRVAEESAREVEFSEVVKGVELDDGRFVTVSSDELRAVEPEKSSTIDIEDFVDLDEIDPVYWSHTYYLVPAKQKGAHKPYALLVRAMREMGKVAIGRLVLRNKEHLVTVRPIGDVLALETMYFADEVRDIADVADVPTGEELSPREITMARQLVEALSTAFDPHRYRDSYRERVLELLERKAAGEPIAAPPPPRRAEVIDLAAALEASMAQAGRRRAAAGAGGDGERALEDLSREELYERAAALGVEGRSKMSKRELARAIAEMRPT